MQEGSGVVSACSSGRCGAVGLLVQVVGGEGSGVPPSVSEKN